MAFFQAMVPFDYGIFQASLDFRAEVALPVAQKTNASATRLLLGSRCGWLWPRNPVLNKYYMYSCVDINYIYTQCGLDS